MLGELLLPVLAMTAEDLVGDYLHHYAVIDPWTGSALFGPTLPGRREVLDTLTLAHALAQSPNVRRLSNRSPWTSLLSGTVVTRTAIRVASGDIVGLVFAVGRKIWPGGSQTG